MIKVEQSAEAFRLYHWPFLPPQPWVGKGNHILDTLMITFGVIVRQVLPDYVLQEVFTEELTNKGMLTFHWGKIGDRG